jgi:hypothetical protein
LQTCLDAYDFKTHKFDETLLHEYEKNAVFYMDKIQTLIDFHNSQIFNYFNNNLKLQQEHVQKKFNFFNKSHVIFATSSRELNGNFQLDECVWRLNRITTYHAHVHGYSVFDREELERRLLFKYEHNHNHDTNSNLIVVSNNGDNNNNNNNNNKEEEIENNKKLMDQYSEYDKIVKVQLHLSFPSNQFISTVLFNLLHCLDVANYTSSSSSNVR